MKLVEDYIFIKNYLNSDQCKRLVRLFNTHEWTPHQWYSHYQDSAEAGNTDCKVSKSDMNIDEILIPTIRQALKDYQENYAYSEKLKTFIQKMSSVRLNRYDANKDMKEHVDHIHSIFDGKIRGIPILSIVGLLNNDFTGGELYINNKNVNLKKGDIIIFPSNFMYPHEVKKIKEGERYSYVAWAF